jgi:hypothetical protein
LAVWLLVLVRQRAPASWARTGGVLRNSFIVALLR